LKVENGQKSLEGIDRSQKVGWKIEELAGAETHGEEIQTDDYRMDRKTEKENIKKR